MIIISKKEGEYGMREAGKRNKRGCRKRRKHEEEEEEKWKKKVGS